MRIFLDDEREPVNPTDFNSICREFVDFACTVVVSAKLGLKVSYISFDHDLGTGNGTGLDCAKWLCERDMSHGDCMSDDFSFYVHSQNPVGRDNINSYLNSYLSQRSK